MTSFSDVESLKTRFDISEEFGFAAEYPLVGTFYLFLLSLLHGCGNLFMAFCI